MNSLESKGCGRHRGNPADRARSTCLLIEHFARKVGHRSRKPVKRVSPEVVSLLRRYAFPGNVRELENAIEHAFVMCAGDEIRVSHLPTAIVEETAARQGIGCDERSERDVIRETLQRLRGNRRRAARELGIHRATLWRKMKTFGLDA